METTSQFAFATDILDILPNPVLVKNQNLEYVWINKAFEQLFSVERDQVIGKLDTELFPNRQVSQCNGGDLRVLENGEVDEAVETVFESSGLPRETITRKSRLSLPDGVTYLIGVMHDITDVTRANEALTKSQVLLEEKTIELSELVRTDALTGCSNRRALEQIETSLLDNETQSTALLTMDIDKFKNINDSFGHDCGDALLTHFARVVRSQLSSADIFIRMGGEEFLVCISGVSREDSELKANRIHETVQATSFVYEGKSIPSTLSIGIAYKEPSARHSLTNLLKIADEQLYIAKSSGRNKVVLAA